MLIGLAGYIIDIKVTIPSGDFKHTRMLIQDFALDRYLI